MNGFVNVYKEPGFTSFDCVAKMRRIAGQKKIGHMGTLDPDASGVLPVALGKATRLISLFDENVKTYQAVMLLGITTDTLDMSGTVIRKQEVSCTAEQVRECILSFLGTIRQIPPMFSALKKDGKRLYELAREGKTIEREAREVTIFQIDVISIDLPEAVFTVTCSKGTYIRTLCDDIGTKLGCGACMKALERTRVGDFHKEGSYTLKALEQLLEQGKLGEAILPMEKAFPDMPRIRLTKEADLLAHNGNAVPVRLSESSFNGCRLSQASSDMRFWIYDSANRSVGVFRINEDRFIPVKMVYED